MLGLHFFPLDMQQGNGYEEEAAAPYAALPFTHSPAPAHPCDLRLIITIPQMGKKNPQYISFSLSSYCIGRRQIGAELILHLLGYNVCAIDFLHFAFNERQIG